MMATKLSKAQFDKALAKHGVTLDIAMLDADVLQVDTPKGKVFRSSGCHTIVEQYRNATQSWKAEAYACVVARINTGIDACEDSDCDVCTPEETNG